MSVKSLAESSDLTSIPSTYTYTFTNNHNDLVFDHHNDHLEQHIPIIDFSNLIDSSNPHLRSKAIKDLGQACEHWGFFMVINHGIPEELVGSLMEACRGFFNLNEEEKKKFEGEHLLDPIRCGTSFNASADKVLLWRDFLKFFVHPEFHCPNKPSCLSEISLEFSKRIRQVTKRLLEGISESLGLEAIYIDETLNLESEGFQFLIANLYPPCPQPELAMGLPPHSDHSLLTVLTQNGIDGLQIQYNGMWINAKSIPNSFMVNIGDQLEIWSNGKYKSVVHRAVVNNKETRISVAMQTGPSLDTIVNPAPKLVDNGSHQPAYIGTKYKDYLGLYQSNQLDGKSCLDRVRMSN